MGFSLLFGMVSIVAFDRLDGLLGLKQQREGIQLLLDFMRSNSATKYAAMMEMGFDVPYEIQSRMWSPLPQTPEERDLEESMRTHALYTYLVSQGKGDPFPSKTMPKKTRLQRVIAATADYFSCPY